MNTFNETIKTMLAVLVVANIALFPNIAHSSEAKQDVTIQTVFGEGHIVTDMVEEFARQVRVFSDNRIKVTVRYGSPYGGVYEMSGQVARGLREITTFVASSEIDPKLTIGFMGGLVSSYEEAEKVYGPNGPFMSLVNEIGAQAGFKYIAWAPTGFGGIAFRDEAPEALPSPETFKVRVAPVKSMEERYRSLGFNPVPMPYSETYTALQTGAIDGKGATPPQEGFQDFGDITKVYVYSRDYFEAVVGIGVSLNWLNELTPEDRAAVERAGYGATRFAWSVGEATEREFLNKFRESGVEVVEFSADDYRRLNQLAQKSEWPIIEEIVGTAMMNRIRKMAQN